METTRPPIVTILGHVDHGKTTLLDFIRKSSVASKEHGGITQHIGAYQVEIPEESKSRESEANRGIPRQARDDLAENRKITFIDTPGHVAFEKMRSRGAQVADIAILVIAADDGIMPQTTEAIHHIQSVKAPLIIAVNKIDLPQINLKVQLEKIKKQLSDQKVLVEEYGGDVPIIPLSAKTGEGVDKLLEMILLVSEMHELKGDPEANPAGVVIEANLDKFKGSIATLLIRNGTLKKGDQIMLSGVKSKIRGMFDFNGKALDSAGPSTPVEVLGSSVVPSPGDILHVTDSDKEAKMMAEKNKLSKGVIAARHHHTLEDFSKEVEEGEVRDLNLIVKADVQGSLEALLASLKDIYVSDRRVRIVHAAVGNILESDVLLAEASNAFVIGFSVTISPRAREISEEEGVDIKIYDVIYKLLDDVKKAMEGMLKPEYEEVKTGSAEVRQTFRFSKVGAIAGCFVKSGKMVRGHGLRIFRNGEKIYEGKLESLKRFKEDIKEVSEGYECGIAIVGYQDFEPGDIIETFEIREKSKK